MKISFLLLLTLATFTSGCTTDKKVTEGDTSSSSSQHEDPDGFYTCPMHPQVHTHEPGNCPICGMALVKVSAEEAKQETTKEVPLLKPSDYQLANAGISRHQVARQDIALQIPVAGRLVGPQSVVFQVYEKDLAAIRPGISFQGRASTDPASLIRGKITRVDNLIDPSSRTLRVSGALEKSPRPFALEGMFTATIEVPLSKQLVVPEEAVLHTGRKSLVYKISEKNEIVPVAVELGLKAGNLYQVLSGVEEGETISGGPNFLLDSESKIRGIND